MPKVVVKVKTTRQYRGPNNIPSIQKRVSSNSAAASYNYARRTTTFAKQRVHVITGYLRDSIHHEKIEYGKHKVVVGASYGVYEEYGTRYRPAHPYFRPAIQDAKRLFMADMARVFKAGQVNQG